MIELWPFQGGLVEELRQAIRKGFRSSLLVSPTGSGKTVMFAYLVTRLAENGMRSMIIAHRQELLAQISKALRQFGAGHGFIAPGEPYQARPLVHVASVFSLVRRLERIEIPDYVIVDEAHHAVTGSTWGKVLAYWRERKRKLVVIGVTATPQRLSGEGLRDTFAHMILGPTTADLIEQGYLARYKMFAPMNPLDTRDLHVRAGDYVRGEVQTAIGKPKIVGDAIAHYREHLNGAPTIVFTPSVESAHFYAEQYRAHGYRAAAIDGTSSNRREVVRDFSHGRLNLLMSCDLVSEGFDVPGAHGAQMLRPTESLALYLQQCGRVLRRAPGKEYACLLDHVGNSARHGLPCEIREWTLEGKKRAGRSDVDAEPSIRQCSKCGAVTVRGAEKCPECGHVFPVKARSVEVVDGELTEVDVERLKARREQGRTQAFVDLVALGKRRGYKSPELWARHVMEARAMKGKTRNERSI